MAKKAGVVVELEESVSPENAKESEIHTRDSKEKKWNRSSLMREFLKRQTQRKTWLKAKSELIEFARERDEKIAAAITDGDQSTWGKYLNEFFPKGDTLSFSDFADEICDAELQTELLQKAIAICTKCGSTEQASKYLKDWTEILEIVKGDVQGAKLIAAKIDNSKGNK